MNFNAVIGVLLAIPFLAVIIPLLANGDAAFNGLLDSVFDLITSDFLEIAAELFVTIILAPLAISYAYSLKKKTSVERSGNSKKNRPLANSISVPFLSMISLTYIVYLFSQLAYFFSAFSGILPKNYEYSASVYARRGFYEIFVICIINISIITFVNLFTKKKNGRFSAPLKALECFICAISIVFIITAMAKMKMNIENFGLSVNRMLVSLLEVMLLVVIVFIIVHIFNPRVNYMQAIIIICSVLFIGFVYADADAIVAKYNVEAYRSGKLEMVDVGYLGHELSDSAMPYIAELANDKNADGEIRDTANAMLNNNYIKYSRYLDIDGGKMTNNHKMPFERINLSREIACNVIADYYNSLDSEAQKEFVDNGSIYFGWA